MNEMQLAKAMEDGVVTRTYLGKQSSLATRLPESFQLQRAQPRHKILLLHVKQKSMPLLSGTALLLQRALQLGSLRPLHTQAPSAVQAGHLHQCTQAAQVRTWAA